MSQFNVSAVAVDELLNRASELKQQGLRFAQCHAIRLTDPDASDIARFDIIYSFVNDAAGEIQNLRVTISQDDEVPSVGNLFPVAFMFENEMHDLFGIKVTGITIDFQGGFYRLHIPMPMAAANECAKKPAKEKPAKASKAQTVEE